jgi:hypothetical protein
MDTKSLILNEDQVTRMKFGLVDMEKKNGKWTLHQDGKDESMTDDAARNVLMRLSRIHPVALLGTVDVPKVVKGDPEFVVDVTLKDGKKQIFTFYKTATNIYAYTISGCKFLLKADLPSVEVLRFTTPDSLVKRTLPIPPQ